MSKQADQPVHELLKPRVRCKGTGEHHFPGSEFKPGEILDVVQDGARLVSQKTGKSVDWLKYKRYPHLFEEIHWWEDREEKDMPDYVTYRLLSDSKEKIVKVGSHFISSLTGSYNKNGFVTDEEFYSYSKTQPATETEYNEYQKSKP